MYRPSAKGKLETTKVCFKWDIPNFCTSCSKVGQDIQSPFFYINQLGQWFMKIYPMGEEEEESKEFVSVYLFADGRKITKTKFSISILDVENKKYHTVKGSTDFSDAGKGFRHFIKRSDIIKNNNVILPDNTLSILCEIIFNGSIDDGAKRANNNKNVERSCQGTDLENTDRNKQSFGLLFDSKKFSDIKIMCTGNMCIYAHKSILVTESEVFQTMFMNSLNSNNDNFIEIKDIEYTVLREMFRYIYTSEVSDIDKIALELLAAAQKYLLKDLTLLCEKSLCDNLSTSNAIKYLNAAHSHGLTNLQKKATDFILLGVKDLMKVPEFQTITSLHPDMIDDIFKHSKSQAE